MDETLFPLQHKELTANCFVPTPPSPPRGTSYTSFLIHTDKDHFFPPSLIRVPPAGERCCRSIPPCAPAPALSSCDAGTALPNRPLRSKRACAAEPAAVGDRRQ